MKIDVRTLLVIVIGAMSLAAAGSNDGPIATAPTRLLCHAFETPLNADVDTRDSASTLGVWVLEQEARGWQVDSTSFDVARKTTGFAQGWTQVCMAPVPSSAPAPAAGPR